MAEIAALNIPLVIARIFECLSNEDLVRCRLVGPKYLWNREACKILRQEFPVVFKQTRNLRKFNDTFQSSIDEISMLPSKFLIYMIEMQESSENQEMLEKEMQRFGRIARQQVQELTIHESFDEASVLLKSMLFNFFPNLVKCDIKMHLRKTVPEARLASLASLPNQASSLEEKPLTSLKEVKLTVTSTGYGFRPMKGWQECTSFTVTLLASAPQLETFELTVSSDLNFSQNRFNQQFKHSLLKSVTSTLNSSQLKNITLKHAGFTGEYLRFLSNHPIQFHLEEFTLDNVDTNTVYLADLAQFLNRHRATLRNLNLTFKGTSKLLCFPFGVSMSKLSYLYMDSFEGSIDWKRLPKLSKISLFFCCLSEIVPPIVKSPSICSPNSFTIFRKRDAEDDKFLAMFIEVTPYLSSGLTILSLEFGYTAPLALIFGECRLLKFLKLLHCKGVNDGTLCGGIQEILQNVTWPEKEYSIQENVRLDQYYRNKVEQVKRTNLELKRPFSYIGDLKDLQYFSAIIDENEYMEGGESTGILSDAFLLYGIIDCKKLRVLQLSSSFIFPQRASRILSHAGLHHLTFAGVNRKDFLGADLVNAVEK